MQKYFSLFKANMQTSWVLSEKERERRFNKLKKVSYRNNLTTKEPVESPMSQPQTPFSPSLEVCFTTEEQLRLESICKYINATSIPQFDKFFESNTESLLHLANATYFGGPVHFEHWKR